MQHIMYVMMIDFNFMYGKYYVVLQKCILKYAMVK